jgi:hypothetical protein
VHHIENFSEKPELRFDVNNGITLRHDVHQDFHKKYGYTNNTREQLDEFIKNYVDTRDTISGRSGEGIRGETNIQNTDTGPGSREQSQSPG